MRPAPRHSLLALLLPVLLASAAALAGPKPAATPQDVRSAERARAAELAAQKDAAARAGSAIAEEQRLTRERIDAAETLRATETATAETATRMEALAARRRDAEARLAKRAESMQPLLPLIERLSLYPAETLLAVPAPPEDRLRGVVVLQGLSRQLEIEAKALRRDRADVDAASAALAAEAPRLSAALAAQAERAAGLDRMIGDAREKRQQAESAGDAAAKRAAAEAARADTLRAALATLEAERKVEEARAHDEALRADKQKRAAEAEAARMREAALARPPPSLSTGNAAKGQLASPVAGRVIRGYGDPTEAGPATGLSYQAPPNARVVAPCAGRVAFADKFRTYGQLLIVDCGGGYHAVLSGLERLDAKVGQPVQAGEPLGVMPHWEPGGSGRHPALYMELRRDGQPVDPGAWLRAKG
jgi:septal ring factor EnvC (AmiA/AmiB activator)